MNVHAESFVSPVADSFQRGEPAGRPESLEDARVGLVDCMLNPSGNWGQGILDGAESAIHDRWPSATFGRVPRPQVVAEPIETWAPAMAKQYQALVIAAGD